MPFPVWPLSICLDSWTWHSRFLCHIALYSIGPCSITSHIHNWVLFLLWFHSFILSGVISPLISSSILGTYWPGEFLFQYLSFCLFILFMGFSRQEYWSGLLFPSPVDHILSDLSTMTRLGWPHTAWLSFIELVSSRVAPGISWTQLSGLKGVNPPVKFGERTRNCSPGQAGKEGPHLSLTGASCGFSRTAAPVWVFSRGTMEYSGSLLCGTREVSFPACGEGSASLLWRHGRGIGHQETLKKDSPSLSRVTSGNSGFPRLVPVCLQWWLGLDLL